ncbi:MAG: hypothetical protein O9301_10495 [Leptospira sp.]|nr:hypothetical protein [Leptospira sp.]
MFVLILFLIFLSFISLFFGWKTKTEKDYLFNSKKTKLLPLLATLVMTEFNPATLIGFSSLGASVGAFGLLLPFVFLIGLSFYAFAVAKEWKRWDGYSVSELFTKRYGRGLGIFSSISLLVAMIGFGASYLKAMYLVVSTVFPEINSAYFSGITILILMVWNLRGGLRSIIFLDLVSFFASIILFGVILYFSKYNSGDGFKYLLEPVQSNALSLPFFLSLVILTMFTYIAAPWYGQKIFSAQSEPTAFKAVLLSAFFVFLFYSIPIFVLIPEVNSYPVSLPKFLQSKLPMGWMYLSQGILFAIGVTTLSGLWSSASSMFIGDFLEKKETSSKNRASFVFFVFGVLSFLVSEILNESVLNQLILANIPVFALSFSLLAGFHWKQATKLSAYLSSIVGLTWGVFCYFYFGNEGNYVVYWVLWGLPMIFVVGILTTLIQRFNHLGQTV